MVQSGAVHFRDHQCSSPSDKRVRSAQGVVDHAVAGSDGPSGTRVGGYETSPTRLEYRLIRSADSRMGQARGWIRSRKLRAPSKGAGSSFCWLTRQEAQGAVKGAEASLRPPHE
jgi:hypothetical protein